MWRLEQVLKVSLVQVGHGDPPLGLQHHVGLAPQVDVDDGRCKLAGLSVHLHGDGLVGGEGHFLTLVEPLTMTADLQCCLETHKKEPDYPRRRTGTCFLYLVHYFLISARLFVHYSV